METIIGIGIIILVAIIWAIISGINKSKTSAEHEEIYKKILIEKGLQPDQILFTAHNDSQNCLSINEIKKKLSLGYVDNNQFVTKEYDFNDVISFELQVDDKSQRKVSIGGAIVGAALAGGLGALIGSQSGKQNVKVRNMHLLITVNSISHPLIKFSILNPSADGKGWNSDGFMVQNAIQRAEIWTGIFNVILKQKEKEK
ncbi:MAG TPA: hypothetical protein VLZ83_07765 [Edaphocola sp.]|nr:hypothetical protein [Edaphocola sp.]